MFRVICFLLYCSIPVIAGIFGIIKGIQLGMKDSKK